MEKKQETGLYDCTDVLAYSLIMVVPQVLRDMPLSSVVLVLAAAARLNTTTL